VPAPVTTEYGGVGIAFYSSHPFLHRVTSLADRLKIDFALIHNDTQAQMVRATKKSMEDLYKSQDEVEANQEVEPARQRPAGNELDPYGSESDDNDVPLTQQKPSSEGPTSLTLVGDVTGKVAFIVVRSGLYSLCSLKSNPDLFLLKSGRYH
jgi:hypothetical protein